MVVFTYDIVYYSKGKIQTDSCTHFSLVKNVQLIQENGGIISAINIRQPEKVVPNEIHDINTL